MYPKVAGYPDYTDTAIPRIYSSKLLKNFRDVSVLPVIANTDHQEEITRQGQEVTIRGVARPKIMKHYAGMTLQRQILEVPTVKLTIDQGEYFSIMVEDVTKRQWDMAYDEGWIKEGADAMRLVVDGQVLADIPASVAATNKGTKAGRRTKRYNLGTMAAPVTLTKDNVTAYFLQFKNVLKETNAPDMGLYAIVPPVIGQVVGQSELKGANLSGDGTSILRNGLIGPLGGLNLYETNLTEITGEGDDAVFTIVAGHKYATTFAMQLTNSETLRSPDSFGDIFRAQQVWGSDVVKGILLAVGYVKIPAASILTV